MHSRGLLVTNQSPTGKWTLYPGGTAQGGITPEQARYAQPLEDVCAGRAYFFMLPPSWLMLLKCQFTLFYGVLLGVWCTRRESLANKGRLISIICGTMSWCALITMFWKQTNHSYIEASLCYRWPRNLHIPTETFAPLPTTLFACACECALVCKQDGAYNDHLENLTLVARTWNVMLDCSNLLKENVGMVGRISFINKAAVHPVYFDTTKATMANHDRDELCSSRRGIRAQT